MDNIRLLSWGLSQRLWVWLAWRLPRPLIYWCSVRLITAATVGRYGDTNPTELDVVTALERW